MPNRHWQVLLEELVSWAETREPQDGSSRRVVSPAYRALSQYAVRSGKDHSTWMKVSNSFELPLLIEHMAANEGTPSLPPETPFLYDSYQLGFSSSAGLELSGAWSTEIASPYPWATVPNPAQCITEDWQCRAVLGSSHITLQMEIYQELYG